MTTRTFGLVLGSRALNWADAVVFLSLVGLLASIAWLGHGLWAPFTSSHGSRAKLWKTIATPGQGLVTGCPR